MSGVGGYLSDDKHWRMPVGWVMMIVGGWSLEGWGLSVDTLLANWPKADLLDEAEVGGYCILVLAIGCSEVIQGVHTVVFWSLCRQWSWSNIWPTVFTVVTRFFAFFLMVYQFSGETKFSTRSHLVWKLNSVESGWPKGSVTICIPYPWGNFSAYAGGQLTSYTQHLIFQAAQPRTG